MANSPASFALTPNMEHFIETGGARVWTIRQGVGPAILLINGSAASDYLSPIAEMFEQAYTVIRFEPRGCGRSDWDGQYEMSTLFADIEAIREHYGIQQWTLFGHSMGVNHSLAFAMAHPTAITGVIGLCGGVFVNDRDWHRQYDDGLVAGGDEIGDLDFRADDTLLRALNDAWKAYIKRPELLRDVAQLTMPCVFIGARDDIRPNWPMQQLASLIPNGHYVEVTDAGHYPWLTNAIGVNNALTQASAIIGT
ncbi:MAG: alpha/beta hydrolase [Pseudomonadota bacterium]